MLFRVSSLHLILICLKKVLRSVKKNLQIMKIVFFLVDLSIHSVEIQLVKCLTIFTELW